LNLLDWARGLFKTRTRPQLPAGVLEKTFGVRPAASRVMEEGARLWWDLYTNQPPWAKGPVRPLGLPAAIGRELSRHALTEFSAAVSGGARGAYLDAQLQRAAADLERTLELGLCLGGAALRPYAEDGRIRVETVTAGFTPTRFDGTGRAVGGVFQSRPVRQGAQWFLKLEYHDFLPRKEGGRTYVVEHRAFRSSAEGAVGAEVPLDAVEAWRGLPRRAEIAHLEGPLFAWFRPPGGNGLEPASPLGVSVYAGPTADLLRQADRQWEQLLWEYRSGERKIFADDTAKGPEALDDRLFLFGPFSGGGDFFREFSPAFRDEPLYRGFQHILQRMEFNVGLSYGTLSDPQSVEKTATEVLAARHRQYVTERAIQRALETALDGLVYAMDALCTLEGLAPAGVYQTEYRWGDGVLDDPDTRRQDLALDLQQVAAGLMNDWEFRMKWYGEDEKTARRMLPGAADLAEEPPAEIGALLARGMREGGGA